VRSRSVTRHSPPAVRSGLLAWLVKTEASSRAAFSLDETRDDAKPVGGWGRGLTKDPIYQGDWFVGL